MKETCPDAIKSYAQCVMDMENHTTTNNNSSPSSPSTLSSSGSKRRSGGGNGVSHGACQEEFVRVKECFRQVRTSL